MYTPWCRFGVEVRRAEVKKPESQESGPEPRAMSFLFMLCKWCHGADLVTPLTFLGQAGRKVETFSNAHGPAVFLDYAPGCL